MEHLVDLVLSSEKYTLTGELRKRGEWSPVPLTCVPRNGKDLPKVEAPNPANIDVTMDFTTLTSLADAYLLFINGVPYNTFSDSCNPGVHAANHIAEIKNRIRRDRSTLEEKNPGVRLVVPDALIDGIDGSFVYQYRRAARQWTYWLDADRAVTYTTTELLKHFYLDEVRDPCSHGSPVTADLSAGRL
jgi:hypothetical protein